MEKWYAIVLDALKQHKKTHFITFLLVLIILIKKYSPNLYILLRNASIETITALNSHLISSLVVFISAYLFYWLARFSDRKYKEKRTERYEEPVERTSSDNKPVETQIHDFMKFTDMKYTRVREIILHNTSQNTIDYLRGWVEIYRSNKRIRLYPFEMKYFRANTLHRVLLDKLPVGENRIDEFHTIIEEISTNNETSYNLFLHGDKVYTIPTNLNETNMGPFERMIGLNLNWLAAIWREHLRWRLKWSFRLRNHYRGTFFTDFRAVPSNVAKNLLRIVFINIPIVCLLLFALWHFMKDLSVLIYELIMVWYNFLSNIIGFL